MTKGKLYEVLDELTRPTSIPRARSSGSEGLKELFDEAKKEISRMKYIPPFVIQSGRLSKAQAKALDEYLRADIAWKFKWFGDEKYILPIFGIDEGGREL